MKRFVIISLLSGVLLLLVCGVSLYLRHAGSERVRAVPKSAIPNSDYSFIGSVYNATDSNVKSAPIIKASINGAILVPVRIEKVKSPAFQYRQGSTVVLQLDSKSHFELSIGRQYLFTTFEKEGHSYLSSIQESSSDHNTNEKQIEIFWNWGYLHNN